MKNFGFGELYITPKCKLGKKAYALASHASDVLDNVVMCSTLNEALSDCNFSLGTTARVRKNDRGVYTAREAATNFGNLSRQEKVALVFGREDWGLSNEELDLCQGYIQIPTAEYTSLNLAQAVQIVAYEWFYAIEDVTIIKPKSASSRAARAAMERMYNLLREALYLIKYTDKQREANTMRLLRRIFDKARLNEREVKALQGLWRQVSWIANKEFEQR